MYLILGTGTIFLGLLNLGFALWNSKQGAAGFVVLISFLAFAFCISIGAVTVLYQLTQ